MVCCEWTADDNLTFLFTFGIWVDPGGRLRGLFGRGTTIPVFISTPVPFPSRNTPCKGSVCPGNVPETPVKPVFSGPANYILKISPVCRNPGGNDVTGWLPKAQEPRLFLPRSFPHPAPGNAAGMRIGGSFFSEGIKNKVIFRGDPPNNHGFEHPASATAPLITGSSLSESPAGVPSRLCLHYFIRRFFCEFASAHTTKSPCRIVDRETPGALPGLKRLCSPLFGNDPGLLSAITRSTSESTR